MQDPTFGVCLLGFLRSIHSSKFKLQPEVSKVLLPMLLTICTLADLAEKVADGDVAAGANGTATVANGAMAVSTVTRTWAMAIPTLAAYASIVVCVWRAVYYTLVASGFRMDADVPSICGLLVAMGLVVSTPNVPPRVCIVAMGIGAIGFVWLFRAEGQWQTVYVGARSAAVTSRRIRTFLGSVCGLFIALSATSMAAGITVVNGPIFALALVLESSITVFGPDMLHTWETMCPDSTRNSSSPSPSAARRAPRQLLAWSQDAVRGRADSMVLETAL